MSAFELSRYLDYSSELLALSGKLAALYIRNFDDPAVLGAGNEIETPLAMIDKVSDNAPAS